MTENTKLLHKVKQEWLEKVMASELTPAAKVFAFGIFKRMFGTKVVSNPTEKQIVEDTGLSRSKFNDYRMSLQGALTMEKAPSKDGGRDRYTYTLNLNWDGNVPSRDNQCTQKGQSMSPVGTTNVPSGDANTTNNTTTNTSSKTTSRPAAPVLNQRDEPSTFEEPKTEPSSLDGYSHLSHGELEDIFLNFTKEEKKWVRTVSADPSLEEHIPRRRAIIMALDKRGGEVDPW
jgi:hypothetical protein